MIVALIPPAIAEEGASPASRLAELLTGLNYISRPNSLWRYGAYLDLSYAVNFNFPENHRWRSKLTTQRVNELTPNMVLGYVWKDMNESSRWGMELAIQGGYDPDGQVPQEIPGRDRPLPGAETLKHFSRANASYLAPVGTGVKLTAGLFNSFIGYESFYAKNNFNYTRTYLPDESPYFMIGVSAEYQLRENLKHVLYVINGYNYLSRPNDLPSYGTQVSWKPSSRFTLTQNFYYGPDQSNTDLKHWRFFSNSIVEWKHDQLILAMSYDIGTENAAEFSGSPRTFWMGGALYFWRHIAGPWAAAVRPEFYWDRNGRLTGAEQFIKAVTTTLEYKLPVASTIARLRLEYRYDDSTGQQGGFFTGGEVSPGVPSLKQSQHQLISAILWTFDSP
ncbi:MAG TPA: outer membrane beta-barrel protein [Nitrospira sp.]|nr:outer membrane beta-barrel protein [Nitrospira sp.]